MCEMAPLFGIGQYGMRPYEGFIPKTPQNAAGMRTDPAPSDP